VKTSQNKIVEQLMNLVQQGSPGPPVRELLGKYSEEYIPPGVSILLKLIPATLLHIHLKKKYFRKVFRFFIVEVG